MTTAQERLALAIEQYDAMTPFQRHLRLTASVVNSLTLPDALTVTDDQQERIGVACQRVQDLIGALLWEAESTRSAIYDREPSV